jgi:hypothetical protein
VFAAVVVTACASWCLFALVGVFERRALPWRYRQERTPRPDDRKPSSLKLDLKEE